MASVCYPIQVVAEQSAKGFVLTTDSIMVRQTQWQDRESQDSLVCRPLGYAAGCDSSSNRSWRLAGWS